MNCYEIQILYFGERDGSKAWTLNIVAPPSWINFICFILKANSKKNYEIYELWNQYFTFSWLYVLNMWNFPLFFAGRRTGYFEFGRWLWLLWKFYLAHPSWTLSWYGGTEGMQISTLWRPSRHLKKAPFALRSILWYSLSEVYSVIGWLTFPHRWPTSWLVLCYWEGVVHNCTLYIINTQK